MKRFCQVFHVSRRIPENNFVHVSPKKKSKEFRSSDLAGRDTGPPYPSHKSGNCVEVLLGLCTKMRQGPIVFKPHVTSNRQWNFFKQHW
jgi:hypothetical protein